MPCKALRLLDNSNIPDHDINEIISLHEMSLNLYSIEDFLALEEFSEISEEKRLLIARKVCTQVQGLVLDGVYGVDILPDDLNVVQTQMNNKVPQTKTVWFDETSGEWKDLVKEPKRLIRFEDGEFKHNFDKLENDVTVNENIRSVAIG